MGSRRGGTALLAAIAAVAGCGGGEGDREAVAVTASEPTRVVATEYAFAPDALSARAAGGDQAPVTINLANAGSLAHNLIILDGDREIEGTKTITGGEQAILEASLSPGEYRLVCTVGDHAERGMVASLRVE